MNNTYRPEFIKNSGLDFNWNKSKIWKLKNIPIEDICVSEIEWQLDLLFWHDGDKKYCVSPRNVLIDIKKYPKHKDRIFNADTDFPIDLMKNLDGELEILDGLHRLCRFIIEGRKEIKVRKISRDLIPMLID